MTVVSPGVTVYVGSRPWSPRYVPPPRDGFTWVVGYYIGPRWIPGYWRPMGPPPRAKTVYVVGHWEGEQFVDGYWRDETNDGHSWNDGYYEDDGTYVEGGWVIVAEDGTEVIMVDDPGPEAEGVVKPPPPPQPPETEPASVDDAPVEDLESTEMDE